jgi:malonyl-CoA/methylmalonyl-CoA synthetase
LSAGTRLLPALDAPPARPALIAASAELDYPDLAASARRLAAAIEPGSRLALWAEPTIATCVGLVAALEAGATLVPIDPRTGAAEIEHVLADCKPALVACEPATELPPALARRERLDLVLDPAPGADVRPGPDLEAPALILYTSGTTGPPKGVVIPRRALAADIDGLADAWEWTEADVVAHALPLNHAHGLVLGVLGPLRLGGAAMLLGRFDPAAVGSALCGPASIFFGVPTMYRRLREAAERDPELAAALGSARLLVSGSAALPASEHAAIERLTGQRVVERYGMTETLITTAARSDGPRTPGRVGEPVPGVELRLVDDGGAPLAAAGEEEIGEIEVRGPTLFDGYLNLPRETARCYRDGWFGTGDMATRDADGTIAIVGRRAGGLIKSGGYRIGAGEIEAALLEHPGVAEAAVTGEPDPDLGERIVAWVVAAEDCEPGAEELTAHTASLLAGHKRPREFRFMPELPRNALGKVQKGSLSDAWE